MIMERHVLMQTVERNIFNVCNFYFLTAFLITEVQVILLNNQHGGRYEQKI